MDVTVRAELCAEQLSMSDWPCRWRSEVKIGCGACVRLLRASLKSGDERAVLALHRNELRHDGTDGELVHVAAEDAAEQWGSECVEHLVAEVASHELSDGLVMIQVRLSSSSSARVSSSA